MSKYLQMARVLICFHVKDMLETIHKWPAKCENHECFLLHEFPVIQYLGKQSLKAQAKIK